MEFVLYLALAFGAYMAWTIGANDASNAMGTSVGSGAISFKEAVIIAAIFEFSGAMLGGGDVTDTLRKGIIDPNLFNNMPHGAALFAIGMVCALIAAAIWLHIAAYLGWPVSTTHSIVGAIAGFGIVAVGFSNIHWAKMGFIASSWVVSPLLGGITAFLIFTAVRRLVFNTMDPVYSIRHRNPLLSFPLFMVISTSVCVDLLDKGLLPSLPIAIAMAFTVSIMLTWGAWILIRRILPPQPPSSASDRDLPERYTLVERVFRYLQTVTACFVAFAHGSNDVANAIGPLAAVTSLFQGTVFTPHAIGAAVPVPTWILLLGGAGIVVGLATYGYKVIHTIGTKITEITPSRGFAIEFGAATTIVIGSKLGVPLSTTHTLVGAIIGVGFARGINALNFKILVDIFKSWVYTIPFTAILTIVLFISMKAIFI